MFYLSLTPIHSSDAVSIEGESVGLECAPNCVRHKSNRPASIAVTAVSAGVVTRPGKSCSDLLSHGSVSGN